MGFGLIFVGYLTLLFFKTMPPAMIAGAILMYRGLDKLSGYGKNFKRAAAASGVLTVYYALYTALWFARMTGFGEGLFANNLFALCDDVVYYGILLAFHLFLYSALEDISKQCGYIKGFKKAYMSRVLLAMFYVLTAVNIPLLFMGVQSYLPLACLICQMVWIIYTAVYIYGCYMRIVTDDILADERKKIAEYEAKYAYRFKNGKKK